MWGAAAVQDGFGKGRRGGCGGGAVVVAGTGLGYAAVVGWNGEDLQNSPRNHTVGRCPIFQRAPSFAQGQRSQTRENWQSYKERQQAWTRTESPTGSSHKWGIASVPSHPFYGTLGSNQWNDTLSLPWGARPVWGVLIHPF